MDTREIDQIAIEKETLAGILEKNLVQFKSFNNVKLSDQIKETLVKLDQNLTDSLIENEKLLSRAIVANRAMVDLIKNTIIKENKTINGYGDTGNYIATKLNLPALSISDKI